MPKAKVITSKTSTFEKLFPSESSRDRAKEAEAEKRFRKTWPPCLNGSAKGFKPGWLTSNMILCPGNWEYGISDILVPIFYKIGIDTPNKITMLNCVFVRFPLLVMISFAGAEEYGGYGRWIYWLLCLFMPFQQMIDCADGQCARRYGLGSEFGAWLDHVTDNVFGLLLSLILVYMTYKRNESILPACCLSGTFLSMGFFGNFWIQAEENYLTYSKMNILHKMGMYQMLFLSYYYCLLTIIFMNLGWFR